MKKTIEVQKALAAEGFYRGDLDGIWGPFTRFALKLFQLLFGITPTGDLDDETEGELFPEPIDERTGDDDPPSNEKGNDTQWPTYANITNFYGSPGRGNLKRLYLPFEIKLAWDTSTLIDSFLCHKKVHASLSLIFHEIHKTMTRSQIRDLGIDMFGGCFNKRKMRGGTKWSTHAWGVAVDFDPARNRLKWGPDRARLAQSDAEVFWHIFEKRGWVSLGRAKGYDFMHVQAVSV